MSKNFTIVFIIIFLFGCSKEVAYEELSVHQLYLTAKSSLENSDYSEAAKQFEEVERQHPYSVWASKAQIMAAYSYYLARKYMESIGTLESFIQLHPAHQDITYAFYMVGLCHYRQISPIERDPSDLMNSYRKFNELIKRFPKTKYASEAKHKVSLLKDLLAGKEMEIARFYSKQEAHHSALGRLNAIIKHYDTTSYIEEALYRSVESYLAIGLLEHAKKSASILGHNYPSSLWYQDAYYLIKNLKTQNSVSLLKNKKTSWWKNFIS